MSYVPAFEPASVRDVAKFHVSLSCWPMDKQTPSSAQSSLQTQNTCQERTLGLVRLSKRRCALVEWQGSADSALCKVGARQPPCRLGRPIADIWRLVSRCSAVLYNQPFTDRRTESQYASNRYLSNRPFDLPRRDGRGCSLFMVFGLGHFCWKRSSSCRPSSVIRYPRVPNHLLVPASINLQPSRSESVLSPTPGDSLLRRTNVSSRHSENPHSRIPRVAFAERRRAAW